MIVKKRLIFCDIFNCQAQSQFQLSWTELALLSPTAYAQPTAYAAQPTAYAAQPKYFCESLFGHFLTENKHFSTQLEPSLAHLSPFSS